MVKFTASLLAEIVSSAVLKVKERKEFDASLGNEIASLIFELEEGSQEFSLLKTIYESLQKKGDAEKFYSSFYGKVALNATKYFKGLTRNAATLLAMKVADSMLVHCKQQMHSSTSNETLPPLTDKQKAGLQYVAGYVLQNLYKKYYAVNSDESQQAMAILKAGKLEISDSHTQKLVSSLNRGGLWSVTLPAQKIFLKTEHYFRQSTLKTGLQKIDFVGITHKSTSDGDILANYYLIVADAGCKPDSDVKKGILHDIVSLYVRVHSFSYAKDIVQWYKIKAKQIKGKSLRKEISRSCHENDHQRQE